MRLLKAVCILFCLLSVASSVTGIRTVRWSTAAGLTITKQSGIGIAVSSLVVALVYAIAAYGIHRRAPIVWNLGWVALVICFLSFSISALSSSLRLPRPDCWIASTAIVVVGAAVTAYWGAWWKRQKGYFNNVRAEPKKGSPH